MTCSRCDRKAHARGLCQTHYSRWLKHGDPDKSGQRPQGALREFITASAALATDECILIEGWKSRPMLRVDGVSMTASRYAWVLANGPIPQDRDHLVLHKCPGGSNDRCINPRHLYLGSDADNVRDRDAEGRTIMPRRS